MIREAKLQDAAAIAEIYNFYILNTHTTFETEAIDAEEMGKRILSVEKLQLPFLLYEMENRIHAYAYATEWKSRSAYKQTAETSIYMPMATQSQGIGTKLYTALIEILKNKNYHALIGGIALPNDKSIALHEKLGFEKVAHFKQVGYKFNQWIDVGYWELLL